MDTMAILIAVAVVGGCGLLIGAALGIFQKVFAVQSDEREEKVRDCLPGNNCGGCGFAGCDALAKAIVTGEAPASACPVAGANGAKAIAAIMGQELGEVERRVAFVRCAGTCDKAKNNAVYMGAMNCEQAAVAPGHAGKTCVYGCTGLGSCKKACPFGAISIVNGVAEVDKDKCTACGVCVKTCPYVLIELVPYDAVAGVQCRSHDLGKNTRTACEAGCIACTKCVKTCPSEAISMDNNVAYIDQSKCTHCGQCKEACPTGIIRNPLK